MTRLHFIVKGRVQGIGYRWFVAETAERLKLAGWVRNRRDGSVEGEAEGTAEALADLARNLRDGHPDARVEGIETRTLAAKGEKTFEIRSSD